MNEGKKLIITYSYKPYLLIRQASVTPQTIQYRNEYPTRSLACPDKYPLIYLDVTYLETFALSDQAGFLTYTQCALGEHYLAKWFKTSHLQNAQGTVIALGLASLDYIWLFLTPNAQHEECSKHFLPGQDFSPSFSLIVLLPEKKRHK